MGHCFVMVMAGVKQIRQTSVYELVTEARGPPITVVSLAVAVTMLAALPAQVSWSVGLKLLENTA